MPINAGKLLLLHKFRKSFAAASPNSPIPVCIRTPFSHGQTIQKQLFRIVPQFIAYRIKS